jgi:hypothetical protein
VSWVDVYHKGAAFRSGGEELSFRNAPRQRCVDAALNGAEVLLVVGDNAAVVEPEEILAYAAIGNPPQTGCAALQEGRFPGVLWKWQSVFDSFVDIRSVAQGGLFFHPNKQKSFAEDPGERKAAWYPAFCKVVHRLHKPAGHETGLLRIVFFC